MKILRNVIIGLAVAACLLVVVGLLLPRTAHVERSIVIDAPQATVFTVLNGFRQFDQWSPWADLDPDATTTLEGPAFGVGAKMSWAGNAQVGSGSQEILEASPHSHLKLRLDFGDFPGASHATYRLEPEGSGTKLTWGFDADYGGSLQGRYFGLLSDAMLGPDYEKGLVRLKAFVEAMPRADFSALQFEPVTTTGGRAVLLAVHSADNPTAIALTLGVAYGRLSGYINIAGLRQAAPPIAIFRGAQGDTLAIDAAIPVDRVADAPTGAVRFAELRVGPAVRTEHRGGFAGLAAARTQLQAYLAAAGLEPDGPMWEQYVSDPAQTPEAQRITHLYAPIKPAPL